MSVGCQLVSESVRWFRKVSAGVRGVSAGVGKVSDGVGKLPDIYFVGKLPESCQKVVKKLPESWQKVARMLPEFS